MKNEQRITFIESNQAQQRDMRIKQVWFSYISKHATSLKHLNQSNQERIGLAKMMDDYYSSGRYLYHMTLTYKPYKNYSYSPDIVNKFFINFYVKSFLPYLLQTRSIHTNYKKSVQPICLAFLDEHAQQSYDTVMGTTPPIALHHHAILAVHPDTMNRFVQLVGTNTLQQATKGKFTHKIMTTDIRECEAQRLLYASKCYRNYPSEYLAFPDGFQRKHCSNKRLRRVSKQ
jgi:hypothetical protein